mmetsp:Transcript_11927/g.23019  ORF Transcript_11927/g.23019 Transcript_11927/m.23019 type:complete len:87 (-) Transcript_11927:52-312(-)
MGASDVATYVFVREKGPHLITLREASNLEKGSKVFFQLSSALVHKLFIKVKEIFLARQFGNLHVPKFGPQDIVDRDEIRIPLFAQP